MLRRMAHHKIGLCPPLEFNSHQKMKCIFAFQKLFTYYFSYYLNMLHSEFFKLICYQSAQFPLLRCPHSNRFLQIDNLETINLWIDKSSNHLMNKIIDHQAQTSPVSPIFPSSNRLPNQQAQSCSYLSDPSKSTISAGTTLRKHSISLYSQKHIEMNRSLSP